MNPPSQLKTILGFLNQSGLSCYPSPLITMVTIDDGDVVHAIFPTGDMMKLKESETGPPLSKEKAMLRQNFIATATHLQSTDAFDLTSFAFDANNIVIGTPEVILQHLDDAVTCDQYTGEDLERLQTAHRLWSSFVEERKVSL